MRRLLSGAVVVVAALLALAGPAGAAHDMYRVEAIPVDASADNAVAARDLAIAQGEQQGFRLLAARLTQPGDAARVPLPDRTELDRLVRSFEVAEEQMGATRYVGLLNVSYNRKEVEELLQRAGVDFVPEPPDPVLLIPATRSGDRLSLWGDGDPWRAAWAETPAKGLLELVLPVGDGDDLTGFTPQAIQTGDGIALQHMNERYGTAEAYVATAYLPDGEILPGTPVRFDVLGPDMGVLLSEAVSAGEGETEAQRLAPVVERAQSAIDLAWKRANLAKLNRITALAVEVPLADLRSWVHIRQGVEGLKPVRRLRIDSLARSKAEITIEYTGDLEELERAIAGLGLGLAEEMDGWRLLPAAELGGTGEASPEPATPL
ncbi:MAG: DUF2066 domain-containing protein [Geminicoccaceae bacterium]